MPGRPVHVKILVALMLTTVTLLAASALAQSQATGPDTPLRDAEVATSGLPTGAPPAHLKSEIDTLRTESALVRELLRRIEEVHRAPYSGAFTRDTAGMDGWVPMVQTVLAF